MKTKTIVYSILLLPVAAAIVQVQAAPMTEVGALNKAMRTIAAALALFMLSLQGLKWVTSESASDRAEAKKGVIYVFVGIIVVYIAAHIVCGLYGYALDAYSITCQLDAANFACRCTS